MADQNAINGMLEAAMSKMREIAGSNTIVGDPIPLYDGGSAVPISKLSFGFGSGGTDLPGKGEKDGFGGGIGGGVTVTPVAFLVSNPEGVRLLQLVEAGGTLADNLIRTVPELVDKVMDIVKKDRAPDSATDLES